MSDERRIYKYRIELSPLWEIPMPEGAIVLSVQEQRGELVLWAEVVPSRPTTRRRFAVVGTGHVIPDEPHEYVATVQSYLGLVWHVFELEQVAS